MAALGDGMAELGRIGRPGLEVERGKHGEHAHDLVNSSGASEWGLGERSRLAAAHGGTAAPAS